MLDWLAQNTDLVALFLAVVGLGVSLFTVWLSIRQARLNAYTRMHELLISADVSGGRRLLHIAHSKGTFPEPGDADWTSINQSLAVFDTLGVYMRRKIVSERLVLSAWHHPICMIREPSEAWLRHREAHGVSNPWPSFTWLLDRADRYHARHG
jgi:hypothetical protein